jgi:hypothetical protein
VATNQTEDRAVNRETKIGNYQKESNSVKSQESRAGQLMSSAARGRN